MVKKEKFPFKIFLSTKSTQWLKSHVQLSLLAGHPAAEKKKMISLFKKFMYMLNV
jgi:hypothetical protein